MPSRHITRNTNESGIAMITVLLVLMLMSALLVGFTTVVMSDQRYRFIDHDRSQAFYAASAGVEKLTADLGNLFLANVAPTLAQITTLTATPPTVSDPTLWTGITYGAATQAAAIPASQLTPYHCKAPKAVTSPPKGTSGYTITYCADAAGNPTTSDDPLIITGTGAYAGMTALQTPYQIDVTAKTATGGEVHLIRTIQAVAIPVFQFGIFSESDLSFFAGPSFTFGGRVHTNGNLWLAQGNAATLQMTGRITAVRDVVRQYLSNGASIDDGNWTGTVSLATSSAAPTGNRNLLRTEGSVVGLPPSNVLGLAGSTPYDSWQTLSLGATPTYYNGFLRNGPTPAPPLVPLQPGTGAKPLRLPLTAPGVTGCVDIAGVTAPCTNVEIVKRPRVGESTTGILYNERLFSKASLRILLSDTAADITNLPGVTPTAPVPLEGNWNVALPVAGYGPIAMSSGAVPPANRPPAALSPGPRVASVNGNSVGGTITLTGGTFATFIPTFLLTGLGVPANTVVTCTGKTAPAAGPPWRLTGCTGLPTLLPAPIGAVVTALSPAGGYSGASAPISVATTIVGAGSTRLDFLTQAILDRFNPWPFWNQGTPANPSNTLVTCTGWATPTYTFCSSNPINNSVLTTAAMSDSGVGTLGGFIKIERQNTNSTIAAPSWTDVTLEILNYGIGDINTSGVICPDPTPNAIVRIQRLRDNGGAGGGGCNYYANGSGDVLGTRDPANWWPNVLFDTREGLLRDANYPNPVPAYPNAYATDFNFLTLGGVMHYVNIDVHNLSRWFRRNTAPFNAGTGNLSLVNGTGFTVYFSDRRNNRNAALAETGEYGWEDFVNPLAGNGVPNGTLQTGEDVNESGTFENYGGHPNYTVPGGVPAIDTVPPCATCLAVYGAPAQPASTGYVLNANGQLAGAAAAAGANKPTWVVPGRVAEVNRAILFRRALMLSQGAWIGEDPVVADRLTGLTVVSENPVYIQGDWNANTPGGTAGFGGVNAATAVIADAVTLLSNQWSDANSFLSPYAVAAVLATVGPPATPANVGRSGNTSWYRVALIAGKGMSFPLPGVGGGIPNDFGTDGGMHNFLRFLEDFTPTLPAGTPTQAVNYLGSMASLYYNRQAIGTYKCCATVYNPPTRNFNFDANFLVPALLPPNTPMFRDMNVIGFSQELRPGR